MRLRKLKQILTLTPYFHRRPYRSGLDDGQLNIPFNPQGGEGYPNAWQRIHPNHLRRYEGDCLVGYVRGREMDHTIYIEHGIRVRDGEDEHER